MKHSDGKVKFKKIKNEEIYLEAETGLVFSVPINFLFGLGKKGYDAVTYKDFIQKELLKRKVYMPWDLI